MNQKAVFMHESPGTQFKVVTSAQLEQETSWGHWKLERVFEETEMLHSSETVLTPAPPPNSGGYYNPGATTSLTKYTPCTVAKFLLKKEESQVFKEMEEKLQEAWNSASLASTALKDLQTANEKTTKALAEAEKRAAETASKLLKQQEELTRHQTSKTALERDIGKIRVAIGELRLKEILESAK